MIDNLKPYGAFVENTLRPFLSELHVLLEEFKEYGLPVDKETISAFLKKAFQYQVIALIFQLFTTSLVCVTVYLIAK